MHGLERRFGVRKEHDSVRQEAEIGASGSNSECGCVLERSGEQQRHGGREFAPVIESLGVWGYKWSSRDLRDEHLDPDFLMWVLHKLVRRENLPNHRVVVFFQFRQAPKRRYRPR